MAVYVDDARRPLGRMLMSHMWADSKSELLAMADRIGLSRRWMQQPPTATWLHFDVCQATRDRAIAAGAISVDQTEAVAHRARLDVASGISSRVARGEKVLFDIASRRARERAVSRGQSDLFGGPGG
ncbi:DUF4031 domain-containing protein [Oharaeibacter diazotrophicus]|uniref:Uncharacterized protein DUF4031 n=1 Tax=Oharaeibacter diazotrophicus TaxID=1920512 RepID=A0A4V3CW80_9HYPH|nr:DUF4031 domain-containing protein [Oharaeibacter diazotrophicus]TDP85378.1 uncharacterized protein DUF4031 [Oharaeibacter diazotrophicus]BBE74348.1 hypothetical protein OHA_1_03979 [Pleomorphomonas sp. SM30]GLS75959.1 hypothetical protein GCM10007904_12940 [Oharaeibacter diazotrophicus]